MAGAAVTASNSSNILDAGSSDDLVAEYRFDTGAGETAYDTSGNNDGTINGATWASGIKGKALSFDGSDDSVGLSSYSGLPSGSEAFTMSTWVKIPSSCSNKGGIFGYGNWGSGDQTNALRTTNSCSGIYHYFWGNDDSTGDIGINDGRWHHVAVTYDGSSNRKIFVDGRQKASDNPGSVNIQVQDVNIGVTNNNEYLNGKIDGLKVYSENLSKSQIRSLYNSGSWRIGSEKDADNSKIMDLGFQHKNSTHVYDISGRNNHGRPQTGATQEKTWKCKMGRCYSFNGSDGAGIDLNDIWSDHTQSRTFMLWFKEAESGANSGDRIISQDCSEWFCLRDQGTDQLRLYYDGATSYDFGIDESEWHHAALVFNESNSELSMYIDGSLENNFSYSSSWSHGTRPVVLGGNTEGTDDLTGDNWEGRVDQVKVFNSSLSHQEIIEKTQGLESGGAVLDLRFNRRGGDKAYDYSLKQNHGKLKNNESTGPDWVEGPESGALEFDGVEDRVHVDDIPELKYKGGQMTVSGWYYETGDSSGNILSKPWNGGGHYNYRIEKSGSDLKFHVEGNDTAFSIHSGPVQTGEWHKFTAVLDEPEFKLYLDGELQGTRMQSFSQWVPSDGGDDNKKLTIGSLFPYSSWPGDTGFSYDGKIGSIKVLPYAMSESSVKNHYASDKSVLKEEKGNKLQNDLILSQTFDRVEICGQSDTVSCPSGMSGKVAVDESGKANHGDLVNAPAEEGADSCKVGSCLGFDGTDDYVETSDSNSLDLEKGLTVSFWAKNGESGQSVLPVGKDNAYRFWFSSGNWYFRVNNETGGRLSSGYTDVKTNLGEWDHVVGRFEPSNNEVSVWVNGKKAKSTQDSTFGSNIQTNTASFYVGGGLSGWGDEEFEGSFDQVKVYNRSLTQDDIWNLYTNGRDKEKGMGGPSGSWSFSAGKVGTKENPAKGCKQIHDLRPGASSGEYWVKPTYEVDKFKVYCEMSENGGGWINMRIANDDENNNMFWFSKYSTVSDHESTHGPIGDQFNWSKLSHMSNQSQLDSDWEFQIAGAVRTDEQIKWQQYGDSSNVYTDAQMSAIRSEVDSISSTTEAFAHTNDDDGCSENGEVDLKKKKGGREYRITHFTSGNQESAYAVETEDEMQQYNDVGFLIPSYADFRNDGTCSGEADHASFGYEKNYTLVRSDDTYSLNDGSGDNSATIYGDPEWVSGKVGSALDFDGSDDYVSVPDSEGLRSNSFSVGGWFKSTSTSGWEVIAGKEYWDNNKGWVLYQGGGGNSYVKFYGPNFPALVSNSQYDNGNWNHVMATYDGLEAKLIVNGKVVDTDTVTINHSTVDLHIGARHPNSGGSVGNDYYNGELDDFRFYPYALSESEIREVMNGGGVSVDG